MQLKLSPISDVISLAEVDNITSSDWGLSIDPPMETVPQTEEELAELAATMFSNEMFVNGLVSQDSTGTVLLVELSFDYDSYLDQAYQLFQKLKVLTAPYQGPEKIQLAGVPMVNVYTSDYMNRDMSKLTPIVILVVMAIMYVMFRMLQGAFIPLSVVLAALVWTLGLMGLIGRPITIVVTAMPVMIIAIGIADGIHLFTEYKLLWAKFKDHDQAILGAMQQLTRPVIFTSLTTMAGFGSLATSSLLSIKDFGIFTSFGVFAAMIFSLTFVPAALKLMKPPKGQAARENAERNRLTAVCMRVIPCSCPIRIVEGGWNRLTNVLQRIGNSVVRHRRRVFVFTVMLIVLSALAITRIKVGSTMVGYFKKDTDIYQASQMLNSKFGGTQVMNIVVNTNAKDGLKDPYMLGKIAALQDTLESSVLVGYTTSLADYVKRINLVMNDNDLAFNKIPDRTETITEIEWVEKEGKEVEIERQVEISGRDQIAQYLLLYENAGGDDLEKLADYDYSKANIVAQIRTDDTPLLKKIEQTARKFTKSNFGSDVKVSYVGFASLVVVGNDLIVPSQLRSLGIALIVVFGLLTLIFRSAKYGLIGLLPLVLTIMLVFALMSVFGVYLNVATAIVASIVLGIGVDYSVHFLSRYRALRNEGKDFNETIRKTFVTSGRAIVFNSLAVAIGFLVLLLSSFWPIIHLGWLVAANMIFSAILTMVLVSAILPSWDGKKKKDLNNS